MDEKESVKGRLFAFIHHLGLSQRKFESACGLSNGYLNNIRRSITAEKLQKIAKQYPQLNTGWLMTGEGDMLRPQLQNIEGDNNFQNYQNNVSGDGGCSQLLAKALEEIAEYRRLIERSQEQVNELIKVVNKMAAK